jgi:hypothetical protein
MCLTGAVVLLLATGWVNTRLYDKHNNDIEDSKRTRRIQSGHFDASCVSYCVHCSSAVRIATALML